MKKEITITIKGNLEKENLENYYRQLCRALRLQYGDEIIYRLLEEYEKEKNDSKI